MNVAKNWALTIMLIALAFAHFSSELSLKEQMFVHVKKTLNNAGHIDTKLIDFSEISTQNPAKSAVFYWLFLGEVFPRNFPWNRPIFLRLCPWKSFEIWLFCAKIPRNRPIFSRLLTFFPRKSRKSADFSANFDFFPAKIPRNRLIFPRICPWKSREILLFLPRNIRSPAKPSLISRIDYNPSVIWISPKNFTCPLAKLRTKITSPIAKSSSPGLSDMTFFACCVAQLKSQTFNFSQ